MYLNANIPVIECLMRAEYMRQRKDGHGKFIECVVFAVTSIPGSAPLFHAHMPDGGLWWRAPISAFCRRDAAPVMPLHDLCLWNSFSYDVAVTEFSYLRGLVMEYVTRDKVKHRGRYLFTLDWAAPDGQGFAEIPGQHKCGHVIELDNGNFAIQPNNRLAAFEPAFVTSWGRPVIERLVSSERYSVEDQPKWVINNDARMDYDFTRAKDG